jgi:short-subunit dehydrogenase
MNKRDSLALITGASSGIGAAFGRKLASQGYRLLLVARRKDRLDKLAAQLGNAEVLAADLTSDADIRRVEERISEETRLELLINNAGFGTLGAFFEADLQSQIRMHQLHVIAIARLTHTALKGMVSRDNGAIINVSSVAAFFHLPLSVSYGATKAWINSFTESIFLELKCMRSPVRVQALCPSQFLDVSRRRGGCFHAWPATEQVVCHPRLALSASGQVSQLASASPATCYSHKIWRQEETVPHRWVLNLRAGS